jgi:hypothetical protein
MFGLCQLQDKRKHNDCSTSTSYQQDDFDFRVRLLHIDQRNPHNEFLAVAD